MQLRHATHGDRRNTVKTEVSKYQLISQPKLDEFQSQCYSKCSKWRPLIPRSNADVCVTDRQRRRSLSLKPVKASWVIRQCALGAHQLK